MQLNHPQTTTTSPVSAKIVFRETSAWGQKYWEMLL